MRQAACSDWIPREPDISLAPCAPLELNFPVLSGRRRAGLRPGHWYFPPPPTTWHWTAPFFSRGGSLPPSYVFVVPGPTVAWHNSPPVVTCCLTWQKILSVAFAAQGRLQSLLWEFMVYHDCVVGEIRDRATWEQ